jgi:hypothetical protein
VHARQRHKLNPRDAEKIRRPNYQRRGTFYRNCLCAVGVFASGEVEKGDRIEIDGMCPDCGRAFSCRRIRGFGAVERTEYEVAREELLSH